MVYFVTDPLVDVEALQSVDEIICPMVWRPVHGPMQSKLPNLTLHLEENNIDNPTDEPHNAILSNDNPSTLEEIPEMGTEVEVNAFKSETELLENEHCSIPFMALIDDARDKLLSICLNQLSNAELER